MDSLTMAMLVVNEFVHPKRRRHREVQRQGGSVQIRFYVSGAGDFDRDPEKMREGLCVEGATGVLIEPFPGPMMIRFDRPEAKPELWQGRNGVLVTVDVPDERTACEVRHFMTQSWGHE